MLVETSAPSSPRPSGSPRLPARVLKPPWASSQGLSSRLPPSEFWVSLPLKVRGSGMHSLSVVLRAFWGHFCLETVIFLTETHCSEKDLDCWMEGSVYSPGSPCDESPIYHR